ncbi:MAG: zinc ABC transporter solute-binding protein [Bacteroidetes bacterium]|nr:zinc ABC transporter solute-binding protein [Bacteroidota bacterium]
MYNKLFTSIFTVLTIAILVFLAIYRFRHKNFKNKLNEISQKQSKGKLKIITTTGMIKDAIKNIADDYVIVEALMGPGVDPHSYKAKPNDLNSLKAADLIFYNGLHLEGKISDLLENYNKIKPTIKVCDALEYSDIIRDKEFSEGVDPHIWFDVNLWKKCVRYISTILQNKIPKHAETIKLNTDLYLKKLDSLHNFIMSSFNEISQEQRVLITAHDAFGYFGRAYNLEVKGLQGISTAAEYGLKDVSDLIQFIIQRKIKAIFIETSVPEKPIRAVIEGCKNNNHEVILGGPIYSDAMGPQNSKDGTYIGMLEANVNTIVRGLKLGSK